MDERKLDEVLAKHLGKEEKKKSKFSKFIITLVILLNTAFAVAVLWIFKDIGTEPTSLIVAWFAFTTGELWLLASVKKTKVKEENNERGNNY